MFLCVFRDLNDKRALQGQKRCNKKCLKILLGSTMDGSGGGTKKLLPNRLNKYNTCDPFAHVMNHDCVDIVRCVALWETSIVIPATKPKKQQVILSCPKSKNTTLDAFHLCPPLFWVWCVASRMPCVSSFCKTWSFLGFFFICVSSSSGERGAKMEGNVRKMFYDVLKMELIRRKLSRHKTPNNVMRVCVGPQPDVEGALIWLEVSPNQTHIHTNLYTIHNRKSTKQYK